MILVKIGHFPLLFPKFLGFFLYPPKPTCIVLLVYLCYKFNSPRCLRCGQPLRTLWTPWSVTSWHQLMSNRSNLHTHCEKDASPERHHKQSEIREDKKRKKGNGMGRERGKWREMKRFNKAKREEKWAKVSKKLLNMFFTEEFTECCIFSETSRMLNLSSATMTKISILLLIWISKLC